MVGRSAESADVRLDGRCDPLPGRRLVVALEQSAALADHLAERPERHALAVGRRAALVPERPAGQAVGVLGELPGEPALADAGFPGDRHEPSPTVAARGVEGVADEAELDIATDERRLETLRPADAPDLGHDPQRAIRGQRLGLALELQVASRLEGDRAGGGAARALPDQDRAGRGRRLEATGRVHQVTGDQPLVGRTDGDRSLAGQDTGAGLEPPGRAIAQGAHGGDHVEGRADRPLGIVLVAGRGTPHGHDRIADELLDGPAVAADDLARAVEVARQEVADGLGVAALGQRREPDEVSEQDGDDLALGATARGACRRRRAGRASLRARRDRDAVQSLAALVAELRRVLAARGWQGGAHRICRVQHRPQANGAALQFRRAPAGIPPLLT